MSQTPFPELLSPDGARLVGIDQVEAALSALWKSSDPQRPDAVAGRICAANLIVVADARHQHGILNTLGELSTTYPARTIVILRDDNGQSADIRASVSAVCHMPQPDRPQVCSEQIILHTPRRMDDDLDRTILPMLDADLPVMLWWTTSPEHDSELLYRLELVSERAIIDAGPAGISFLEQTGRCIIRDLGWYQAIGMRELLARTFDGQAAGMLQAIEALTVATAGRSDAEKVETAWLVAFLGGQLNWQPLRPLGGGEYEFKADNRLIKVALTIHPGVGNGIRQVMIQAGDNHIVMHRCGMEAHEYRLIVCDQQVCDMPRTLQILPPTRCAALASAMTGRKHDRAFERAAPLAHWLISHWQN